MPQPELPSPIAAEEIFRVTAALPAAERAAYLEGACEGQPAVRARLERMLQAHEIGAFLRQGTDDPGAAELEAELASVQPERAGERIGHYELIERLGEGGFGVVWVAAQEQPVRRKVALKIIKLGMDTREVIARFEQERQALALMDHPGIAKVFDAGATPTGRPYFVMELVQGVPITDYCDRERLPTADRLQLFIAVCQAVQHAHQKGIIHRDLKPSNILVAVQDGVAVPKVIDFGVAKATQQQRLSELTVQTGLAQMIGTPLYMSPEQAELSALDIDTRADIYALGVLLYELLTGRTPFDPEALMRAGLDEMRRAIREQEPPKPSAALHSVSAAARTTVAQRRQVDGARLIGQLRGDLDWIVMKALEKDRARRYETASDFALDVRRHLASEPVAARAPSFGYQAGKFVRRHRGVVAAAGAVLLALLAGLIASTMLYLREKAAWTSEAAQRQKADSSAQRAETEAGKARAQTVIAERNAKAEAAARRKAEAIANFLTEVFQSPAPQRDGRTVTVASILGYAAARLTWNLGSQPEQEARLQEVLGGSYMALGLSREAIPLNEKVRDYYVENLGPQHPDTLRAMDNVASSYAGAGRHNEALKLREQVLELRRKIFGPEHAHTLGAMSNLASSYADAGRKEQALQLREQVLELRRKTLGPDHRDTLGAMADLASSYFAVGRRDEALKLREHALELHRKIGHGQVPVLREHVQERPDKAEKRPLLARSDLANSYEDAGRKEEALKLREQAFELTRNTFGLEHADTLGAMDVLAVSYRRAGRMQEAIDLQEKALAIKRRVLPSRHSFLRAAITNLADCYEAAGRAREAQALRQELAALEK